MSDWVLAVEVKVRISCHWHGEIPTVNSKVFEGRAGGLLNTGVMTVEEVEDRIEGFVSNGSIFILSNFCKCKGGDSLKDNAFGQQEFFQCVQWRAREEVSIRAI